jgi:hypothetical protein
VSYGMVGGVLVHSWSMVVVVEGGGGGLLQAHAWCTCDTAVHNPNHWHMAHLCTTPTTFILNGHGMMIVARFLIGHHDVNANNKWQS